MSTTEPQKQPDPPPPPEILTLPPNALSAAAEVAAAAALELVPEDRRWLNVANCMRATAGLLRALPCPPWRVGDLVATFTWVAAANPSSQIGGSRVLDVMAAAIQAAYPDESAPQPETLHGRVLALQACMLMVATERLQDLPEPVPTELPGRRVFGIPGPGGVLQLISPEAAQELLLLRRTLAQMRLVLASDLAGLVLLPMSDSLLPPSWRRGASRAEGLCTGKDLPVAEQGS